MIASISACSERVAHKAVGAPGAAANGACGSVVTHGSILDREVAGATAIRKLGGAAPTAARPPFHPPLRMLLLLLLLLLLLRLLLLLQMLLLLLFVA